MRSFIAWMLIGVADGHGAMTFPRPRNALDGDLDFWKSWSYPCDETHQGADCAIHFCYDTKDCRGSCPIAAQNGIKNALNASNGQACYWFNNGCTIGCNECDGTNNHWGHGNQQFLFKGMDAAELRKNNMTIDNPFNPPEGYSLDPLSMKDVFIKALCDEPSTNATICDPRLRTANTQAQCGGPEDIYFFSPWRAPGSAPVIDACGMAGGRHPDQGDGGAGAVFQNSSVAKAGDAGSQLPAMPSQATWEAGSSVEVGWTVMANHGGGYAYRLAPADGPLTEEVFRKMPLDFVGLSIFRWDGNVSSQVEFDTQKLGWETREGTTPKGSMWRKNPIPSGIWNREGSTFEPACEESDACRRAIATGEGGFEGVCRCSHYSNGGFLLPNLEVVDNLKIPLDLTPGRYVLQWRWDCEETDQVWTSCSDVTVTAPTIQLV